MTSHPLDECDPQDCYQIMMSERTELIKARREAEDGLIKTVVQLSSGLIILLAGFAVQPNVSLDGLQLIVFAIAIILLALSVLAGLSEHYFSSKAYQSQQKLLEDYYSKIISEFDEPIENKYVKISQISSFSTFIFSLFLLSAIAIAQVGDF